MMSGQPQSIFYVMNAFLDTKMREIGTYAVIWLLVGWLQHHRHHHHHHHHHQDFLMWPK